MTEPRIDPTTGATSRGGTDRTPTGPLIAATVAVLALVSAFIPGLFFVAWILGAIAIAVALPTFRSGSAALGFASARVAVIAGALALVFGLVNLGIVLEWFDYFTTGDAMGTTSASILSAATEQHGAA